MQWLSDTVASVFGGEEERQQQADVPQEERQLQTSGMLTKAQLLAFFDACRAELNKTEVKQMLQATHAAGQDVEERITQLQKELFQQQGINGNWGIHCLGRINTEHRDDSDFIAAFYQFVMREEAAVDEAVMPADAFTQKQEMMKKLEQQQNAFKSRMEGMSPEKRQHFLQQQQIVIAQMQQQQAMMGDKMEKMSQEERAAFIQSQMDQLEHALQQAAADVPDARDSTMSQGEREQFFKGGKAS